MLGKVTTRIVNEVNGVNRVFYDCTGKPPATIEFIRHGMRNQKLKRGGHLMIPHNCHAFDLLTMREGHCNQTNTEILNLTIARYGNS